MSSSALLLHLHSHLRYLILLAGVVFLLVILAGMARRKPAGKADRIAGSVFTILMDIQLLLGLGLVLTGHFYAGLTGHVTVMLGAIGLGHVASVFNRRRPAKQGLFPVLGAVGTLALLVVGILLTGHRLFGR